ncbi:MAG: hypothetical protein Q8J78_15260 [Moraxellaceae bacterium]|nr:hypothetical protein [Moraxellaceae bacterium]
MTMTIPREPKKQTQSRTTALLLATTFSVTPMSPALAHKVEVPRKVLLAIESDELDCGRQGSIRHLTNSAELVFDGQSPPLPATLQVAAGKTLRLALKNLQRTDIVVALGSAPELAHYGQLLKQQHDAQLISPNIVAIAAQSHAQLIWQFTQAGEFDVTAFQRDRYGRWQPGPTGKIIVQPAEPLGAVITPQHTL